MKKTATILPMLLLTALLGLAACTPTVAVRGNMLEEQSTASVKIGSDTQTDVLRKLGSPTTKAPFDDKIWYYIGQRTEKKGILDAKIVEEKIYRLTFNAQGTLDNIEDVSNKRENIPLVREKTPTSGSELTVLQQLLGNVGRFNKNGEAAPGAAGP